MEAEQKKIETEKPQAPKDIIYRKCKGYEGHECTKTLEIPKGTAAEKFIFRCEECYPKFVEQRDAKKAKNPPQTSAPQPSAPNQKQVEPKDDQFVQRKVKLFRHCMKEVADEIAEIRKTNENIYFSPESFSTMVDTLFMGINGR